MRFIRYVAITFGLFIIFLIPQVGFAATRYVATTGTDSGTCTSSSSPCDTIQYAVDQAGDGDVIQIAAGTYTENDIDLPANESLSFVGASATTTIIDGGAGDVIFVHQAGSSSSQPLLFSQLTLQNGSSASGGAIRIYPDDMSGTKLVDVEIRDVIFKNNTASQIGGGLFVRNCDTVTLTRVTFSGNSMTGTNAVSGGASFFRIVNNLTLENVTFSGNTSAADAGNYGGGAIFLNSVTNVAINNSTFADNTSATGGGIYAINASTITISNSIFDGNTGGSCYVHGGGTATFVSAGYNISSAADAACNFNQTGDQVSTDPLLDVLANNGGEVTTMALLDNSPAIDAANNATCESTDARGETRPADGDGDSTATCDMGAYEIVCGDGLAEGSEVCDDGNSSNSDSCLNTCVAASCGDGAIRTGVEECDNAGANSDVTANACRTDCTNPGCGDGVTDTSELCDDGNSVNTDTCLNTCTSASCGDGVVQSSSDEVCDDGEENSDTIADACRSTCVTASCGDGAIDADEECDDGNSVNTDACLTTCEANVCGDGVVESDNEECDDGSNNSDSVTDACRSDCFAAACGDDILDTGESCDDGNVQTQDGCSASCVQESFQELETTNPDTNFSNLQAGQILSVTAPTTDSASISAVPHLQLTSSCSCTWTLSPSDFGELNEASECTTNVEILGPSQANLGVSVDCDGEISSYNQTLVIGTAEESTSGSSGGCQLNPTQKPTSYLFWISFLIFGLARRTTKRI